MTMMVGIASGIVRVHRNGRDPADARRPHAERKKTPQRTAERIAIARHRAILRGFLANGRGPL
jgi:hypothetical protein